MIKIGTEKQVKYIISIAEKKGLDITPDVADELASKPTSEVSRIISHYKETGELDLKFNPYKNIDSMSGKLRENIGSTQYIPKSQSEERDDKIKENMRWKTLFEQTQSTIRSHPDFWDWNDDKFRGNFKQLFDRLKKLADETLP